MSARIGGRRSFGPVLLLGLAGSGLAAVAGSKPWAALDDDRGVATVAGGAPGEMPLAGALALVVLACWGVLLVTRGVVRRAVAALAVLAALGTLAAVIVGWSQTTEGLRDQVVLLTGDPQVSHTAWWWVALAGTVVSLVASALAVRLTPQWPEMGRRYDAPAAAAVTDLEAAPEEQSNLDLWKALDEGHDPTEKPGP